jgi:MarR family transcriptional regulator for hemolysin
MKMKKQNLTLGMILGRIRHEMARVLKKRFGEQAQTGLTLEQYALLHALNRKGYDVIQKEMAEIMGKDKSAILRFIDSLEEKELVKRVIDTNDRRKNYILVTKKGEREIEKYLKIELGLIGELQEDISKSDIDIFYKVINQIKSKVEKL